MDDKTCTVEVDYEFLKEKLGLAKVEQEIETLKYKLHMALREQKLEEMREKVLLDPQFAAKNLYQENLLRALNRIGGALERAHAYNVERNVQKDKKFEMLLEGLQEWAKKHFPQAG